MKGFLYNAAIFLLIWIFIFSALYTVIPRKYYASYEYELQTTLYKKITAGGLKGNVIIGDSKTQLGLDARNLHATNLCMGGVSPVEGYYQLRLLLQNPTNKVDTVFISYTLTHLVSQYFFYTGSYYNGIIPTSYLDSVRVLARQYNDENYALSHSDFSTPLDIAFNDPVLSSKIRVVKDFVIGGLNSAYVYLRNNSNPLAFTGTSHPINGNTQLTYGRVVGLSTDSVLYKRSAEKPLYEEELSNIKTSVVNKIYLQKMLDLCNEKNVTAFFIMMPSQRSAADSMLEKQVAELDKQFGKNFIYDTAFYSDASFRDQGGHLNVYGVQKFQSFILAKLYGKAR